MAHAAFRVQRHLSATLKRAVVRHGLGLSSTCQQQLERTIRTGVERMRSQRALLQEDKLRLAEENLVRCIQRMGEESERSGAFPLVDEDCLSSALTGMCPLWPYC